MIHNLYYTFVCVQYFLIYSHDIYLQNIWWAILKLIQYEQTK